MRVRLTGFEPACPCDGHPHLKLARIPIPPQAHVVWAEGLEPPDPFRRTDLQSATLPVTCYTHMRLSCARRDGRQRSPSVHCAPRGMDAVAARMPRRAHVSHHPLRGAVSRPRYRHRSAAVPRLMALMPFHCVVLKFQLPLRRAAVHSTEAYAALTLADGCPFGAKAFASC